MKKAIMMFCMFMGLLSTNVVAQEVRGVETRRTTYVGNSYYESGSYYNKYYGFEFTNRNSIPVSVSIEVYRRGVDGGSDKIMATKEIVLISGESYIMKKPAIVYYESRSLPSPTLRDLEVNGEKYADYYYVKYKAYKLQ